MIALTNEDIGRKVIYASKDPYRKTEEGVITSFNQSYVFVRYGNSTQSQATSYQDLEFTFPTEEIEVTPEMIAAGLAEAGPDWGESYEEHVTRIYRSMEARRRHQLLLHKRLPKE